MNDEESSASETSAWYLAKCAASNDGQRLEIGRAEPLPLQARVVPFPRLQLVQVFPSLGVRNALPLQFPLQLAAPVCVKSQHTVASACEVYTKLVATEFTSSDGHVQDVVLVVSLARRRLTCAGPGCRPTDVTRQWHLCHHAGAAVHRDCTCLVGPGASGRAPCTCSRCMIWRPRPSAATPQRLRHPPWRWQAAGSAASGLPGWRVVLLSCCVLLPPSNHGYSHRPWIHAM